MYEHIKRPELIKDIKTKHNLSDIDLANELGISRSYIWAWETSKRKVPIKYLESLYGMLQCNVPLKEVDPNEEYITAKTIEFTKLLNKELKISNSENVIMKALRIIRASKIT